MKRATWVFLLMGILLFGAHTACAAPKFKLKPYKFEPVEGEPVKAELGTLPVRENRSREDSRIIKLKFVRFPSTSSKPGSPIIYLAGGPGGSGIDAARGTRFSLFMALREFGDVIALDQRGTGMTGFEDLDCDDRYQIPLDKPANRAEAGKIVAEVTRGCMDRLRASGVDLSAYNTMESAADLEDLRVALGADKLTLWGISYGTHLALAAMKHNGEHIDRVILAGLEALHHSWKLPSDQQQLLEEISRLANQDPVVSASVPDFMGSLRNVLEELERAPKTITLVNPRDGKEVSVTVGKFDAQAGISNMLRGPASFATMPDALGRVERGDWTALALASVRNRSGEGIHSMSAAMDCASGADAAWLKRIATEADDTLLADAINFPFPEVCEGLDIPDLGDEFRAPVRSDIPALLISGTLDGRTPVRNGEEVLEYLPNGQHLVIEGAGHSDPLFLSSPLILESMQAFLRGETIPQERITLPPVQFVPPRTLVQLEKDELTRFTGIYRIEGDDVRKVVEAGNMLFTVRGRSGFLPIRPTSATEFFYEGSSTNLFFEVDAAGKVTGMVVFHDGSTEGEAAEKIE